MSKFVTTFISIFLFLAAGIMGLFLRDKWAEYKAIGADVKKMQDMLQEWEDFTKMINQLNRQVSNIPQSDIDKLLEILPPEQDATGFIRTLDFLVRSSGLALENINVSGEVRERVIDKDKSSQPRPTGSRKNRSEEQKDFEKLPFSLSVVGSYNSFKQFLKKLELNTRLIDIDEVSISPSREENKPFAFKISGNTYYLLNKFPQYGK